MKRKRFIKEQVITILKEHEAGIWVQDLVRKHNVSEQSIYRWKKSTVAWKYPMPGSFGIWRMRIGG